MIDRYQNVLTQRTLQIKSALTETEIPNERLNVDHISGILIILLCGWCLATIVFLFELKYQPNRFEIQHFDYTN